MKFHLPMLLSLNLADQRNQSSAANSDLPTIELPTNARGVPTVEALSIVLRHAQRLLNDHAVAALAVCTLMRLCSPIS